jgi:hypothetical protein
MATFKVVSAQKQDRLRPDGGRATVYVVWLETAKGATGSLEIPEAVWAGDGLKEYLEDQASVLDKAFDLINVE